jgi:hypothetical protein
MASVVIAGNTSGSVTLDAPAVAGTTVLTLPATSGTVVTTATTTGISGSAITTGTVGVSVGGTGANTLTANNVILGNGTSAVQFVAPGSTGNVLTSNGTTWTSAAAGGGQLVTNLFTSPGTWTNPGSTTSVRVTVYGGGGGGGTGPGNTFGGAGGYGGLAVSSFTIPTSPVSVTVGSGGNGRSAGSGGVGSAGGTSSFGPYLSATGGAGGGTSGAIGAPGTGTLSAPVVPGGLKSSGGGRSIGYITGVDAVPVNSQTAAAYSISAPYIASASGDQGSVPSGSGGGIGGAVLVEFIG